MPLHPQEIGEASVIGCFVLAAVDSSPCTLSGMAEVWLMAMAQCSVTIGKLHNLYCNIGHLRVRDGPVPSHFCGLILKQNSLDLVNELAMNENLTTGYKIVFLAQSVNS